MATKVIIKANSIIAAQEDFIQCSNCVFYKTEHCEMAPIQPWGACRRGVFVFLLGRDACIVSGDEKLVVPLRHLSASKTKNRLMEDFVLSPKQVEEVVYMTLSKLHTEKREEDREYEPLPEPADPEIEKAARELLMDPKIVERFIEDSSRAILLDVPTRMIMLLTCVSALGKKPHNLAVLGPWSIGKTWITVNVTSYFDNVWTLGGMSPKALIHQRGEYNEEADTHTIDLRLKIIIFLDKPQNETLEMLKPLLSRDKPEIEYKYVEKETGRTWTALLRGWPVCIFCAVASGYTEEYKSRWMTATPMSSPEKRKVVIQRKGEMAAYPERYSEAETFKDLRRAFAILAEGGP